MNDDTPNSAQRQRNLQEGREGDKIPGFDPAAAPMDTDAEAAGSPTDGPIIPPPSSDPDHSPNSPSDGSAMRRLEPESGKYNRSIVILAVAACVVIALLLLLD